MNVIVPIDETEATVTLTRTDYEALIERLEEARDLAAIDRSEAWRAVVGEEQAQRLSYTAAEARRMALDDVSALTIWRERSGLSQRALARRRRECELSGRDRGRQEAGQRRRAAGCRSGAPGANGAPRAVTRRRSPPAAEHRTAGFSRGAARET